MRASYAVIGCAALGLFAVNAGGQPQRWGFDVDRAVSTLTTDVAVGVETSGTLIGDYDAVSNPGGTRTIPGLFGGSGNNPIDVDMLDLDASGQETTTPSGSFTADVSLGAMGGTVVISGLSLDMLGGAVVVVGLEASILYDSFHTEQPNALFPGGVAVTLPIGDAEVTRLEAEQVSAGAGTLVPTGQPDEYTLAAVVPVRVSFAAEVLGGTPLEPDPVELPLALAGTLTIAGSAAELSLSSVIDIDEMITKSLPTIEDLPFELPTVLPPGSTAGVLLNLDVQAAAIRIMGSVDVSADGMEGCYADCDDSVPGVLDIFDFLCFQDQFVAGDPVACACDVSTGATTCDIFDFLCFQDAFVSGCP